MTKDKKSMITDKQKIVSRTEGNACRKLVNSGFMLNVEMEPSSFLDVRKIILTEHHFSCIVKPVNNACVDISDILDRIMSVDLNETQDLNKKSKVKIL